MRYLMLAAVDRTVEVIEVAAAVVPVAAVIEGAEVVADDPAGAAGAAGAAAAAVPAVGMAGRDTETPPVTDYAPLNPD
jgi:hypothetical protein